MPFAGHNLLRFDMRILGNEFDRAAVCMVGILSSDESGETERR